VADLSILAALPELTQDLPGQNPAALAELAVEYQRLFGFNLPPYESVFVDPSGMLATATTERIQHLYRQGAWQPPSTARTGAADHLGLELWALAGWLETGQTILAQRLQARHLALWLPAFVLALRRLKPQLFYATLGDLTLELVLATLPENPLPPGTDPFPVLLSFSGAETGPEPEEFQAELADHPTPLGDGEEVVGLRDLVARLLLPCQAGLFLTREDIARLSQVLDLPPTVGGRSQMLEGLFRMAGQYELVPTLFEQLQTILVEAQRTYQAWAAEFPVWTSYAQAWGRRLDTTYTYLEALKQLTLSF
jgi:TorA maturation chaperone TorD